LYAFRCPCFFLAVVPSQPRSTPFPYTTLFRSLLDLEKAVARDYEALAHAVLERYGRLDGLLHNAGLLGTLTPIEAPVALEHGMRDRKSTRLNSSHVKISYAVFCLKKKKQMKLT